MKTITYDETKWKLVPVVATKEMLDATKGPFGLVNDILAQHQLRYGTMQLSTDGIPPMQHAWKAMLSASPTPPK